ncbi:MAG: hypothetical protein LBU61_05470 [Coriobacteriales bacterium]|jgi:hypothetical protein|nr:hypothetical protein [Coriobacteriales bacterium]
MSNNRKLVKVGAILLISAAGLMLIASIIDTIQSSMRANLSDDVLGLIYIFQIWCLGVIPSLLIIIGMAMLAIFGFRENRANQSGVPSPWSKRQSLADTIFALGRVFAILTLVITHGYMRTLDLSMPSDLNLHHLIANFTNYSIVFFALCLLVAQVIALFDASRIKSASLIHGIALAVLLGISVIGILLFGPVNSLLLSLIHDIEAYIFAQNLLSSFLSLFLIAALVVRATWALTIDRQITNTTIRDAAPEMYG